jgi:hypothetical protein
MISPLGSAAVRLNAESIAHWNYWPAISQPKSTFSLRADTITALDQKHRSSGTTLFVIFFAAGAVICLYRVWKLNPLEQLG